MDKKLFDHLFETSGILNMHDKAMFNLFVRAMMKYQLEYGIPTKQLKQFMQTVLTFVELMGDSDDDD